MGLKTLMILITARRALTADELCHALAIDLENPDDEFDEDNIPSIDYVLSSCAGLVIIEDTTQNSRRTDAEGLAATPRQGAERPSGSRLVHIAHRSIRDYLSSTSSGWFSDAESKMALICRKFTEAYETSGTERGHHFMDYVRDNWAYHQINWVTEESERPAEPKVDLPVSQQASLPLAAKQAGDQSELRQLALELEGMREDLLLCACRENRTKVVKMLVKNNLDSYQKPLTFERASQAGEHCGYAWCYESESFPDIYPRGENLSKSRKCSVAVCAGKGLDNTLLNEAVVAAAFGGRMSITETLLEHGASITGRDRAGYTALGAAASTGQSDILGWLLGLDSMKFNLLLDFQPRFVYKRMHTGYEDMRLTTAYDRLLLELGDELRACHGTKDCALQPPLPSEGPSPHESPPPAPSGQGDKRTGRIIVTPLVAAASNGREKCVNLILQWAKDHSRGKLDTEWKASCMNAMLSALHAGHVSIMRALLPFIDVNYPARGFNNYTLLHFAVLEGNPESLGLLLADKSVDLSLVDDRGRTALALAATIGADDLIMEFRTRSEATVDPLTVLEALLRGNDSTFNHLWRLLVDCNPGSLFKADSSGYSCFDRIVFKFIREMAGLKKDQDTDITSINVFDWNPMPPGSTGTISPVYRQGLERLTTKLLEYDNYPTPGEGNNFDEEHLFGINSLLLALTSGSDGLLRALIELYPVSVCDATSKGGTILMAGFARGTTQCIDLILETLRRQDGTAVINSTTVCGQSTLTAAVAHGRDDHSEQFLSLLKLPDLNLRLAFHQDAKKDCPLISLALQAYQHAILPLNAFKSNKRKERPATYKTLYNNCWQLLKAAHDRIDRQDLPNLCLQISEDCSRRRRHGLIHILCQLPQPGCLELLLQSCPTLKSQLHVPDREGMTAVMQASKTWRNHETFMFILNTPGVDVSHRDNQGRTALSLVAENLGQFSDGGVAATLVADHGQDLLAPDKCGWSPLHYAIANGNVWEGSPYHRALADPKLPVGWTDGKGSNPLHLAIKGGSPLAIRLLLQHSASSCWVNAPDVDGMVPLAHFFSVCKTSKFITASPAADDGRPDILPDTRDNEGRTPLWHALSSMRQEARAFAAGSGTSDGGHFQGFLAAGIEALCAHDGVDPGKYPRRERHSPADLAAEVVRIHSRGQMPCEDGDGDTAAAEYAGGERARIRAMIKGLSLAVREEDAGVVVERKKPRRRRRRKRASALTSTGDDDIPRDSDTLPE
ncbi:hypothetical protein KVR01_002502 [Diaporthe batatas]|uniref:uncharacterized protein n=1 Tax=Diaporthe batatas TaxID=748121 RepID=UPI001D043500|nr:uncharacterized protein KVR01_002502 [Diaporthe batatas]KAG8166813.1 hypothetical protein KVR01_002502 [Diaporthe batatas]